MMLQAAPLLGPLLHSPLTQPLCTPDAACSWDSTAPTSGWQAGEWQQQPWAHSRAPLPSPMAPAAQAPAVRLPPGPPPLSLPNLPLACTLAPFAAQHHPTPSGFCLSELAWLSAHGCLQAVYLYQAQPLSTALAFYTWMVPCCSSSGDS
jgi:hypothetical protein